MNFLRITDENGLHIKRLTIDDETFEMVTAFDNPAYTVVTFTSDDPMLAGHFVYNGALANTVTVRRSPSVNIEVTPSPPAVTGDVLADLFFGFDKSNYDTLVSSDDEYTDDELFAAVLADAIIFNQIFKRTGMGVSDPNELASNFLERI